MNTMNRTIGVTVVSMALLLATGCNTPSGALTGGAIGAGVGAIIGHATGNTGLGAAIGAAAGAITGGIIGHLNEEQKAQLQQQSPQTLEKIQHNDDVAQQQGATSPTTSTLQEPTSPASSTGPQATSSQMQPLTVDDIKALASAGVKDDVVTAEIQISNSKFSQHDITELQQAGVSSGVIQYIQANATS
jgi:hypothetical protein